ncbi:MAG: hypothetical protein LBJ48_03400, partial [Coriobacteriales bacterium]|nr:hypothetical protein [Coriobacteriales bacterium]
MRSKHRLNDTGTTRITLRTGQGETKTNTLTKMTSYVLMAVLVAVSFGSWEALASAQGAGVLVQETQQVKATQETEEIAKDATVEETTLSITEDTESQAGTTPTTEKTAEGSTAEEADPTHPQPENRGGGGASTAEYSVPREQLAREEA